MVRNAFVRSENIYKHAGRILPQGHSAKTWISKIEKKKESERPKCNVVIRVDLPTCTCKSFIELIPSSHVPLLQ